MPSEQQTSTTPGDEKDEWRTPPWLFRFLNERYGPFDIDLAANSGNYLVPKYFSEQNNALSMSWIDYGRTGFLNPPYSDPDPFVRHAMIEARDSGFSTVIVLPTHRNQKWAALAQYCTERIEFEGRVVFHKPDGTPMGSPRGGTQIFYFRGFDLGYTRTPWISVSDLRKRYED